VGGAVRNFVLDLPVTDYDFTTSATPEEILGVFSSCKTFAPGIKHGTVCVRIDGETFEITTFRTEEQYLDNRHPSAVSFTRSLKEDLKRRDFTVNAMCFDGDRIIDLHGGLNDCSAGIIRAIGDPIERFDEDALRILRALRFASRLSFNVEEKTKNAIFARKSLLLNISCERIREELNGILLGNGCYGVLKEFRAIIAQIIPEISHCFDFDQRSRYHAYDVYEHTVRTVDGVPPVLELRLAALLHDIGKPQSFVLDDEGYGHFYGHPGVSLTIAENVLTRLKYSNVVRDEVLTLVKYHDYPIVPVEYGVEDKYLLRSLRKFGESTLKNLLKLKRADNLAKGVNVKGRLDTIDIMERRLDQLIAQKPCFCLKDLALNGNDLIALGLNGKQIGEALNSLLDAVVDGRVENDREALIKYFKNI